MSYQAPSVGPQGLTVPSFNDILELYIDSLLNIYGNDFYTGNDSPDIQLVSVIALAVADCMNSAQLSYNNRSPVTAIGAALDAIVKINGLRRKVASFSSCQVTITGTVGTVILGGAVQDINGNKWDLPSPVTIPQDGSIIVTAICETPGAINALIGDLSIIATPTAGWTSVTNAVAAIAGQPVETDSQLRARQALSVSLPSQTMLSGTIAAIAAVAGVTRYSVAENPTGATDANNNPPHSITAVVEGGADADIAQAIYANRGLGCFMNGTTEVDITDEDTDVVTAVRFSRPTYQPVYVSLTVKRLTGFTSATQASIQTAIVNYLNSLQIGESLTISGLYAAAMSVMSNISLPIFSITSLAAGAASSPTGTVDIPVAFDHVTQGIANNIVITLQ